MKVQLHTSLYKRRTDPLVPYLANAAECTTLVKQIHAELDAASISNDLTSTTVYDFHVTLKPGSNQWDIQDAPVCKTRTWAAEWEHYVSLKFERSGDYNEGTLMIIPLSEVNVGKPEPCHLEQALERLGWRKDIVSRHISEHREFIQMSPQEDMYIPIDVVIQALKADCCTFEQDFENATSYQKGQFSDVLSACREWENEIVRQLRLLKLALVDNDRLTEAAHDLKSAEAAISAELDHSLYNSLTQAMTGSGSSFQYEERSEAEDVISVYMTKVWQAVESERKRLNDITSGGTACT